MPTEKRLRLSPGVRATLERWVNGRNQYKASRAKVILLAAEGALSDREIAAFADVSEESVTKWVRRFEESGLAGLDGSTRI